jgi:hypothetical protein
VPSEDLDDPAVLAHEESLILEGVIRFAHFGLPCTSWFSISRMNWGSRRKHCPLGNGTLGREVRGNQQMRNMLRLIAALEKSGGHWCIENPSGSYLWHTVEPSVFGAYPPGTVDSRRLRPFGGMD